MRFLFSCSNLGKEAAKLRKLKRYKPTKFMAEGSRYDKEAADAAVTFINCLKHTKGEWYGMPFELIDWQEQIVRDIFGILKPNGYRQFNTAYIEIPKKQGKSELAAAIALYLTCGDFEHGGEVYGCASDRQQASIVFDVAVDMVEQCPALKSRIKPMLSQKRLVYKPLGSFYQVLSAEAYTKHGLNVHGVVFDELHAQPNRDLYDVMLHGSGDARKQPLFFLITTAGTDRNSICWEVHQKAEDILQGRKIDPTFYPVIYSAADTDDWTSEKVWRKVNPSLGITVDIEKLRGLTTRQLAEKLNIVPATVLGYEQGRFPIPYEITVATTKMLQIPESLLFDDYCVFISAPYTELLYTVRKRYGLNQVNFAEKACISPSIYAKWESGSRRPSRKMYQQLKVIYPEI